MITKENFKLTLHVQTPLFIGSGETYSKKEYIYNKFEKTVSILNSDKFMLYIMKNNLIDEYENFIIRNEYKNLYDFLKSNKVSPKDIEDFTMYKVDVSKTFDAPKALSEIKSFSRTSGRFYIPGSSLKGALRTVILTKMIKDRGKHFDNYIETFEIEKEMLGELNNCIMRGILISDSEFIPDSCISLFGKNDLDVDGKVNKINILRECVKPHTNIDFQLTIDYRYLIGDMDIEYIQEAISDFSEFYTNTYITKFKNNSVPRYKDYIVLGGGSGYFGKNISYISQGYDEGLKSTANIMHWNFKRHGHLKDISKGISPHMLKCTSYNNELTHFGICTLSFSEI